MSIIWDTDDIGHRLAQLRGDAPSGRVFGLNGCPNIEWAKCEDAEMDHGRPPNWRMTQHMIALRNKENIPIVITARYPAILTTLLDELQKLAWSEPNDPTCFTVALPTGK